MWVSDRKIAIVGNDAYANALQRTLGLFFDTVSVPVQVNSEGDENAFQEYLAILQNITVTTLILCCEGSFSSSSLALWVRFLREKFVTAEIIAVARYKGARISYSNSPLLYDKGDKFQFAGIKGHKTMDCNVALGSLVDICLNPVACGRYVDWETAKELSLQGRIRELCNECSNISNRQQPDGKYRKSLMELANILLHDKNLAWSPLLGLDSHNPQYSESFITAKNNLAKLIKNRETRDIEIWNAIKEILAFTKEKFTP